MATIYSLPEGFPDPPDFGEFRKAGGDFDFQAHTAAEKEWTEKLREALPRYSKTPKSDLVGYIYRSNVADGYAAYMVLSTKPLELIHLPLGDDYKLPPAHERGLRVADIRAAKEWNDKWADLASSR